MNQERQKDCLYVFKCLIIDIEISKKLLLIYKHALIIQNQSGNNFKA